MKNVRKCTFLLTKCSIYCIFSKIALEVICQNRLTFFLEKKYRFYYKRCYIQLGNYLEDLDLNFHCSMICKRRIFYFQNTLVQHLKENGEIQPNYRMFKKNFKALIAKFIVFYNSYKFFYCNSNKVQQFGTNHNFFFKDLFKYHMAIPLLCMYVCMQMTIYLSRIV